MAAQKPSSKGQAWFCTTGLPSDVVIEVDDMAFHLHRFPLMSKSRKLHNIITEHDQNQKTVTSDTQHDEIQHHEDDEENVTEPFHITLPDFPGGSESFETAAKFCYGVKIEISATNAAALRCAGEYLEMTDEYSEGNLISKIETFISQNVLKSIKHSLKALASCDDKLIMPMAEDLGIVRKCIESVVAKAAVADPSLFGWPVSDDGGGTSNHRVKPRRTTTNIEDPWLDEVGNLSLPIFRQLILAMKASSNLNGETVENCLIHYATKSIPGISRATRKQSSTSVTTATHNEQRELLESIVSYFPMEKKTVTNAATSLLFGLLRTAYILNASEDCRLSLEKRIGWQLEQASLDDLLIPSYSYLNETLYDVDCVERILDYFLQGIEREQEDGQSIGVRSAALMAVGKLIDGYLSEIASDSNLKPERFYDLAVSLPDHARLYDDGLYRAIDVYLKAHPWISEADREKICGNLDFPKLTLEACTHAAQNQRLPLRAVVQVLFFEQLQLRHAIAGTLMAVDVGTPEEEALSRGREGSSTWRATVRENQVLRVDMDGIQTRVHELERECTTMRKVIERYDRKEGGQVERGVWRNKFGCKFKTQVCDSHQPTVVEAKRDLRQRRRRELQ